MCFVLYAGTSKPMLRKEWHKDAPDLSVKALTERESPITAHFTKPEVQLSARHPIAGVISRMSCFRMATGHGLRIRTRTNLIASGRRLNCTTRRPGYATTADR